MMSVYDVVLVTSLPLGGLATLYFAFRFRAYRRRGGSRKPSLRKQLRSPE